MWYAVITMPKLTDREPKKRMMCSFDPDVFAAMEAEAKAAGLTVPELLRVIAGEHVKRKREAGAKPASGE